MIFIGTNGWPEPALNGSEADTVLGSLERQRATFIWKATGLEAEDMRRTVGASSLTLAGLIKHLAFVEDAKTAEFFTGRYAGPWSWPEVGSDPDSVFVTALEDSPEELIALWQGAVLRSREAIAAFLAAGAADGGEADLGLPTLRALDEEGSSFVSVRRLLADLIEEYGRHTGHADLLRESIDGLVGEDPDDGAPAAYPRLD